MTKTPYQDLVHEVAEKETENESLRARVVELSKSERILLKAVDDSYRSREKISLAFDASMRLLDKLRGQVEGLVAVYEDLKDLPQDERFSIGIKRLTAQRDKNTQLRREIEAMREERDELKEMEPPSSLAIAKHHIEQFGNVPLSMVSTKLAEEVGEVCGGGWGSENGWV